jgi:hypothetical protein
MAKNQYVHLQKNHVYYVFDSREMSEWMASEIDESGRDKGGWAPCALGSAPLGGESSGLGRRDQNGACKAFYRSFTPDYPSLQILAMTGGLWPSSAIVLDKPALLPTLNLIATYTRQHPATTSEAHLRRLNTAPST